MQSIACVWGERRWPVSTGFETGQRNIFNPVTSPETCERPGEKETQLSVLLDSPGLDIKVREFSHVGLIVVLHSRADYRVPKFICVKGTGSSSRDTRLLSIWSWNIQGMEVCPVQILYSERQTWPNEVKTLWCVISFFLSLSWNLLARLAGF